MASLIILDVHASGVLMLEVQTFETMVLDEAVPSPADGITLCYKHLNNRCMMILGKAHISTSCYEDVHNRDPAETKSEAERNVQGTGRD